MLTSYVSSSPDYIPLYSPVERHRFVDENHRFGGGHHMENTDSGFSAGKTGEGPVFNTGVLNADIRYIGVKIEHKMGSPRNARFWWTNTSGVTTLTVALDFSGDSGLAPPHHESQG